MPVVSRMHGNVAQQMLVAELPRRQIDRHAQRAAGPACCQATFCRQAVCSTHLPIGTISPVSSATGMNCIGATGPRSGCSQRSSASMPVMRPLADIPLGLVVELEFVALERMPQARFQRQTLERVGVELLGIELEVVLAFFLGLVHRDIGVLRQRLLVQAVVRIGADADAGGDAKLLADQREGLGDRRREFSARRSRHTFPRPARGSSTTNSSPPRRATVSLSRRQVLSRLGDLLQQLIAGFMSQRVVDLLEAVEIEERHRQLSVVTLCLDYVA